MPRPCLCALVLLSLPTFAQEPALTQRVRDDFATDTRGQYQTDGEVAWRKGRLPLGPNASLSRTVGLGPTAEVEVVFDFPAGGEEARLRLRLGDGVQGPLLVLRRDGGKVTLADRTDKAGPASAVGNGEKPRWRVRAHFGYGLVRAKSWPDGEPEPAGWPLTRFRRKQFELRMTAVHLEATAGGTLRLFRVRGAAAAKLSEDQRETVRQAHAHYDEAGRQHALSNFREALARYAKALALYRQALPAGDLQIANSVNGMARAHSALGQQTTALKLYEQAQILRGQILPEGHPDLGKGLHNLASVHDAMGRPGPARALYEQALAIFRRADPSDRTLIPTTLSNLGIAYHNLGQGQQAQAVLEEALALHRSALPAGHPRLVPALHNLGMVYADLNQPDRARALYEEAVAIARQARPPRPRGLSLALGALAALLADRGQYEKARELFEEALALDRKILPGGHPAITLAKHNLARVYAETGRLEKARDLHEEALAELRRALPEGHFLIGRNLCNLGLVYVRLRQVEEGHARFAEALALYRKALPAGHPELTLPLNNLALTEFFLGRHDAAWRLALEAAALDAPTRLRILAGSPQRDHLPLLAKEDTVPALFLLAGDSRAPPGRLREFLGVVAARQALGGLSARLRHEAVLVGGDAQAAALYGRLKEARQQQADLLLRDIPAQGAAGFRERVEKLQREQDGLERELARQVQGYAPLAEAARTDPDALAARLGEGEALVMWLAYPFTDPKSGRLRPHYGALLLWRAADGEARVRFLPLGATGLLDAAVRAWRAAVQKGAVPDGPDRELRDKLWGPVAQALPKGVRRLAVVPDGQLALLPLGALRQDDGAYLLEKYAIRYLGAARDLLPAPNANRAAGPAVVLSDPAYDLVSDKAGPAEAGARPPAPGRQFRRLPGFAREAAAAETSLRSRPGWDVRPLRGAAATEEAVAALKRPRLLYLITHGYFLEDVPRPAGAGLRDLEFAEPSPRARRPTPDPRLRSGLALAGANRWRERSEKGASDGLLTAAEVENLDLLGTELVILSACETGLGEVQVGEGVLGLRRAFQLAGAQTVVASLWKVPDDQTETLMTGFLKRWLSGAGKAEALRQAQLDLIRQLRQRADTALRDAPPLYWAGFVCHGRPD